MEELIKDALDDFDFDGCREQIDRDNERFDGEHDVEDFPLEAEFEKMLRRVAERPVGSFVAHHRWPVLALHKLDNQENDELLLVYYLENLPADY